MKFLLRSLTRPCRVPGSVAHRVCVPSEFSYVKGVGGLSCGVLSGGFGFFKCRHCRTGLSFHGRSEIQAGRAPFLFVPVNLSLYLITTFPQRSKSVNRTESTMLEENTTLHILTAALSIKVPLF